MNAIQKRALRDEATPEQLTAALAHRAWLRSHGMNDDDCNQEFWVKLNRIVNDDAKTPPSPVLEVPAEVAQ